jgi:cytochrome c
MSLLRTGMPAALALALACTSACGGKPPAAPATVAPAAAPADLNAMLASADTKKGKILFLQCRACHSVTAENEPGKIGPTLYGVLGRPAGTVPGFIYSDAVAKSGLTWTPENIARWIERPSDFLPGNKMVFIGILDPQDRANVIAYIRDQK